MDCSLIEHVLQDRRRLQPASTTLVVGHGADAGHGLALPNGVSCNSSCKNSSSAPATRCLQTPPLAARQNRHARAALGRRAAANGGDPVSRCSTHIRGRRGRNRDHRERSTRPFGYGRIVRTNGRISKIVEERDASPAQKRDHRDQLRHLRVRSGGAVRRPRPIGTANKQGEYYLPISSRSFGNRNAPSPPGRSSVPKKFAASTAARNLQRSAPWSASRRTKS